MLFNDDTRASPPPVLRASPLAWTCSRVGRGHRDVIGFLIMSRLHDRGKGVPSFDEMMDIALVEVDFDDPTTNVRGRRALAIAKPTPRGY